MAQTELIEQMQALFDRFFASVEAQRTHVEELARAIAAEEIAPADTGAEAVELRATHVDLCLSLFDTGVAVMQHGAAHFLASRAVDAALAEGLGILLQVAPPGSPTYDQ